MSEQKEQNAKQNEQENSSQKQDGLNFSEQDFEDFVRRFSDYLANANESKKRGNNDYNPLKAVQNPHDEVNMHSGFLASLLNTRGEHYQDDLFLRLFLQALGLAEWFGSTKNAQVFKEKKNIDIHIFNSEKHIIIENKIWYDDQPNQIARYIDAVKSKNVEYKNIAMVYLSPFGREPSPNSLDKWQINDDLNLLEFDENKVKYKQVSYKKDILKWIESCQKEVGNITNLNSALEFYKDIVKIITYQKESKMSIAEFFEKETDFEVAFEICKNEDEIMWAYLKSIVADESFCKKIKGKIGDNFQIECDEAITIINESYGDNNFYCGIGLEWFEKKRHFKCYVYIEGEYEARKDKDRIQKHLDRELYIIYDYIFIKDMEKIIENPINIKDEILAWLDKELIELTNQINEKLKNFKI